MYLADLGNLASPARHASTCFITERMGIHLVWTTGRLLLKPIPRFLLEPRY